MMKEIVISHDQFASIMAGATNPVNVGVFIERLGFIEGTKHLEGVLEVSEACGPFFNNDGTYEDFVLKIVG